MLETWIKIVVTLTLIAASFYFGRELGKAYAVAAFDVPCPPVAGNKHVSSVFDIQNQVATCIYDREPSYGTVRKRVKVKMGEKNDA